MSDAINRTRLQQIYDAYRTSLLNRIYRAYPVDAGRQPDKHGIYFRNKLSRYRQVNFWIEITIAVGATGSGGIAGLGIWRTTPGAYAWVALSGIATILAVIKPILQLAGRIENYTKLYAGYTSIFLELTDIVDEVAVAHVISATTEDRYLRSRQLLRELELMPLADTKPVGRLIKRLQEQVNKEIPPDSLWTPDG